MSNIKLRNALEKDKKILFKWFNEEEDLKYKLKTKSKISFTEHSLWFSNILSDSKSFLWIIELKKKSVGQIRLDYIKFKYYEIDIHIDKMFRGMNIGKQALMQAEKKLLKECVIISKVKKNNLASLKFFKTSNFVMLRQNQEMWILKKRIKIN